MVRWSAVANAVGYTATAAASGGAAVTGAVVATETGAEATFTGLTAGTAYTVTVTARGGASYADSQATLSVTTLSVLATPVVSLGAGNGALTARWAAVPGASGYAVQYRRSGVTAWTDGTDDTSPAAIAGLTNGQAYEVRVRALAGSSSTTHVDGAWSEAVEGTPATDTAPTFGDKSVAAQRWTVDAPVNLALPEASGGNGTLRYALSPALPAGVTLTAATRTIGGAPTTAAGAATYTWTVSDGDTNTASSDAASLTFEVTVGKATLAAPTNLAVKPGTLTSTGFTVQWDAVASASDYTATATSSGGTAVSGAVTRTEAAFTGLSVGTAYTVSVTATGNASYADGPAQTLSVTTSRTTAPTRATSLQVRSGNGSLSVSWTAASHAPSGYSVRWRERRSDSTLSAVSTVTGTSYTIPGLTNGTTYVVRLDTRNAADTGVEPGTHVSETGTPRPPLAAPVMVVTVLAERIELRWDAVDHAEEYELGYREQPAQATDEWPVDESKRWVGPERALYLQNLKSGQVYEIRVRALPASDAAYSPSPWSEQSAALASLEATAGLDALPTVGAAATLTGSASGGQEPYGYAWTVTGEPTGSAVTLTGAETAGPSFTPTHVGTYTLRVTVTDGAGTTATAEVSAEAGHPGAATGLAARSGNGALAVSWTAAARAPHGYRVRWRARGPTGLNEGVVVRGTSRRIESLANGTTYVVRVDTVNAADDGLASGTRVTTTGTPRASGSASAGLPTVGVHDAQGDEGDALAFRITLSQAAGHTVTVRWRTEAGTAQAGADFASAQGSETFEPGETTRTVAVQTHDDTHDDPGETFRVLLTDVQGAVVGDGEAVGTIRNRDALPEAWLAHFGRTVAEQALDGVAQRLAADRTQGTQGTLAGAPIGDGGAWSEERTGSDVAGLPTALGDWNEEGLSLGDERTMTVGEALAASHFTLTGERDEAGASVALWGRGAQSRFDARAGATDLDGTLMTGLLGADYGGEDWLGGIALAWSDGEGGYREPGAGSGELEASLGAVIPYASLQASERLGLWGAAGYGAGTMTLTPEGGTATQADLDWSMVAAGLRGELLAPRGAPGLTLALVSDALWAQTDSARVEAVGSGSSLAGSESEVTRLRLGLEGRWAVSLEAGGSVAPRVEAGVRHDGGDAGSGVGVELGGGVTWEVPRLGLSLDLAGRTLLAHEADGRRERGLSATVGYDARPGSERGLSLTLRQETGGRAEGGLDALFAPEPLDGGLGAAEVPSRWTAEAAYGLPVFGGRLTASPTVGVGLSGPAHDYSLGWRLAPAANPSGFSVGIKATRQQSDDTAPAHGIELELGARW